ncbi:uncharacterized protein LOC125026914 [Penaeus chinensis]|uniref:uncharacterized protein LOC125026914 n=1 Tax=Penaeus chinensis TaxID=139456 RepID=UPI001FB59962|nr:uncharacterized protein LOC125026914 [Penaeus chinensis]
MVHGKPRHPQSQGSVERANGDIQDMLVTWLVDNNSQDWLVGIKFVQFRKNAAHHSGIKCSPYSARFGCEARVGLTSSPLPTEVVSKLESEDDDLIASMSGDDATTTTCSTASSTGSSIQRAVQAVDSGRGDPRNILGITLSRDLDNDLNKIVVKSDVLKEDNVNLDNAVSLREAVIAPSACGGQGFTRCNCSGLKNCSTNRWFLMLSPQHMDSWTISTISVIPHLVRVGCVMK